MRQTHSCIDSRCDAQFDCQIWGNSVFEVTGGTSSSNARYYGAAAINSGVMSLQNHRERDGFRSGCARELKEQSSKKQDRKKFKKHKINLGELPVSHI